MIIAVSLAVISVFLGYAVAVACLLGATLALASSKPAFVERDFCLQNGYKLAHSGVWLLCTMLGAFATAWIGDQGWSWLEGAVLIGALVTVLWKNTWEARQRGLAFQILLTALTPVAVVMGYTVRGRLMH